MMYEEIVNSIKEMPTTFIPAILIAVIHRAKKEKVFISNKSLLQFINNIPYHPIEETEIEMD